MQANISSFKPGIDINCLARLVRILAKITEYRKSSGDGDRGGTSHVPSERRQAVRDSQRSASFGENACAVYQDGFLIQGSELMKGDHSRARYAP